MARDIPMQQWFGGRPLPAAGISGVATVPEARGTGVGSEVMRELLERAKRRGALVTTLFPATVPFYRRLGYEYAGLWTIFRAPLLSLPRAGGDVEIGVFDGGDVSELRACYRAFADGQTGLVEGEDDDWWPHRVLLASTRDAITRAVVARGSSGVEGYATFSLKTRGEWQGYDIACSHLVARTPGAGIALLRYFRRFQGVGAGLRWIGPPNEPLGLLIDEDSYSIAKQFVFMSRLLDVPGALEARGYPEGIAGEIVLDVDDPQFEDNCRSFRMVADGGKVRVERTEDRPDIRFTVGALSALFSGYLTPGELVRGGRIASDATGLGFLDALFAGPPPWMIDHF
jgi:predicted acetyltransferase